MLSGGLHPHYADVVKTLSDMSSDELVTLAPDVDGTEDLLAQIGDDVSCVVVQSPDVFGNVLSQSGSFRGPLPGAEEPNSTAQAYLAAPRKPIRFYLDAGLYDNVPGANLPLHDLVLDETNLMGNRHLRDVLRAKGYDVTYREVGGGHEWVHWRAMLADGLLTLLGK